MSVLSRTANTSFARGRPRHVGFRGDLPWCAGLPSPHRRLFVEALENRQLLSLMPELVKDIVPSSGSPFNPVETNPNFTNVIGTLYFVADDGVIGDELWKSDGTAEGTVLVKDIRPNAGFYRGSYPLSLTNVNGTLFFSADDGLNGIYGSELWKSDGTLEGTVPVKDIIPGRGGSAPSGLTNVDGTLFFRAYDGFLHGRELWKSDGTADGTVLVKDIRPNADSYPGFLTNVNGTLFFSADDGVNGRELWKSDGTAEGTVLVKDIRPGSGSSQPLYFTNVNGTVFFSADDGVNGYELWKSDGTTDGTVLVKDIVSGNGTSAPRRVTNVNGTLFFPADDGINGRELWKTDGTPEGTVLVKDIAPASGSSSSPGFLTNVNGTLFFAADDRGVPQLWKPELWKSDGTAEGTVLVKDIMPGSESSVPGSFTIVNGTFFFLANDGVHGRELWTSDGTAEGTVLVNDIMPGSGGAISYSSFISSTHANGTLFFLANDGVHGRELWKLVPEPGDANFDGDVGLRDLAILQTNFGYSGDNLPGDLTRDGAVGRADVVALIDNFGPPSPAMSPSATDWIGASATRGPPANASAAIATEVTRSGGRAIEDRVLTARRSQTSPRRLRTAEVDLLAAELDLTNRADRADAASNSTLRTTLTARRRRLDGPRPPIEAAIALIEAYSCAQERS